MKIGALPLFDSKWEIIQFKGKRAQQSHYRIDFHMILCAPLRSFGNVNVYSTKPAVKLFKSVSDQHSWLRNLTPGSPSKFLMAAFVRTFAQKMTAEICPVQPFVMHWTPK